MSSLTLKDFLFMSILIAQNVLHFLNYYKTATILNNFESDQKIILQNQVTITDLTNELKNQTLEASKVVPKITTTDAFYSMLADPFTQQALLLICVVVVAAVLFFNSSSPMGPSSPPNIVDSLTQQINHSSNSSLSSSSAVPLDPFDVESYSSPPVQASIEASIQALGQWPTGQINFLATAAQVEFPINHHFAYLSMFLK